MKAIYKGAYTKRNATTGVVSDVFRYGVSGTPEEIAAYKADQGDNFRTDDKTGEPLFFTTRFAGNSVNLVKTKAGRYIADLSELKAQASLASQFGGNLGQAIANAAVSKFMFGAPATASATPVAEEEPAADDLNKG
jgi:hypothetical protein